LSHAIDAARLAGAKTRGDDRVDPRHRRSYYASGRLGLLEQVVVGTVRVTPLWSPTGVAVASLLLLGLRI
jgi:hypothetical protein